MLTEQYKLHTIQCRVDYVHILVSSESEAAFGLLGSLVCKVVETA